MTLSPTRSEREGLFAYYHITRIANLSASIGVHLPSRPRLRDCSCSCNRMAIKVSKAPLIIRLIVAGALGIQVIAAYHYQTEGPTIL